MVFIVVARQCSLLLLDRKIVAEGVFTNLPRLRYDHQIFIKINTDYAPMLAERARETSGRNLEKLPVNPGQTGVRS